MRRRLLVIAVALASATGATVARATPALADGPVAAFGGDGGNLFHLGGKTVFALGGRMTAGGRYGPAAVFAEYSFLHGWEDGSDVPAFSGDAYRYGVTAELRAWSLRVLENGRPEDGGRHGLVSIALQAGVGRQRFHPDGGVWLDRPDVLLGVQASFAAHGPGWSVAGCLGVRVIVGDPGGLNDIGVMVWEGFEFGR